MQEQDDAYVAKNITAEDIQTSTVPIIGCSTIVGTKNLCTICLVEEQLQGICQNLLNSYNKRFNNSDFVITLHAAFGSKPEFWDDEDLIKYSTKVINDMFLIFLDKK